MKVGQAVQQQCNDKKWKDNYGSQFMKKEEKKGE